MADRFTSEKFQWLEQITFDKQSDGRGDAVRVGFATSTFINRRTGEAWPGLYHLAGILGSNEKTVRRAIEWLEHRGHLTTKRGGKGHPTRYTLKLRDRAEMSTQENEPPDRSAPMSGQNCPDDRTDLSSLSGQNCPTNPLSEQIDEQSDEPIEEVQFVKPSSKSSQDRQFDEFWEPYPLKVGKLKAKKGVRPGAQTCRSTNYCGGRHALCRRAVW